MDFTPLFGSDESNGWGYFFGDIVAMEPLLEGVRYNVNFAHEDDQIGDGHFECSDYGHAALQVTFSNVQASWDASLTELTVAIRANELLDLDTTPVIDPKTHTLAWRTTEGTKATFPGPGVRLGMYVQGARGGHFVGYFQRLLEVHEDGQLTMHYLDDCHTFDAAKYSTEDAVLDRVRGLEGAKTIDFSVDRARDMTSICFDRQAIEPPSP